MWKIFLVCVRLERKFPMKSNYCPLSARALDGDRFSAWGVQQIAVWRALGPPDNLDPLLTCTCGGMLA